MLAACTSPRALTPLQVEIRLAAEEMAARRLEEQKVAIEEERRRMDREREEMQAASKAAMNEQITRTMRMFQEQLAQTVKMAAMLQVWGEKCGAVWGVPVCGSVERDCAVGRVLGGGLTSIPLLVRCSPARRGGISGALYIHTPSSASFG